MAMNKSKKAKDNHKTKKQIRDARRQEEKSRLKRLRRRENGHSK